jgi:hypothetical protein
MNGPLSDDGRAELGYGSVAAICGLVYPLLFGRIGLLGGVVLFGFGLWLVWRGFCARRAWKTKNDEFEHQRRKWEVKWHEFAKGDEAEIAKWAEVERIEHQRRLEAWIAKQQRVHEMRAAL